MEKNMYEHREYSKQLDHDDESGFKFSQEMLDGDITGAINFDRLQKHPKYGYIIFEYLLCEQKQKVTPYTSHPNRYWNKNSMKFLSLWRAALEFEATLYLVNYAKKGTYYDNQILLIKVLDMDEDGIVKEEKTKFTRNEFKDWFRKLNLECLADRSILLKEIYMKQTIENLGKVKLTKGKYQGNSISSVFRVDQDYLYWLSNQNYESSERVKVYLYKMREKGKIVN